MAAYREPKLAPTALLNMTKTTLVDIVWELAGTAPGRAAAPRWRPRKEHMKRLLLAALAAVLVACGGTGELPTETTSQPANVSTCGDPNPPPCVTNGTCSCAVAPGGSGSVCMGQPAPQTQVFSINITNAVEVVDLGVTDNFGNGLCYGSYFCGPTYASSPDAPEWYLYVDHISHHWMVRLQDLIGTHGFPPGGLAVTATCWPIFGPLGVTHTDTIALSVPANSAGGYAQIAIPGAGSTESPVLMGQAGVFSNDGVTGAGEWITYSGGKYYVNTYTPPNWPYATVVYAAAVEYSTPPTLTPTVASNSSGPVAIDTTNPPWCAFTAMNTNHPKMDWTPGYPELGIESGPNLTWGVCTTTY